VQRAIRGCITSGLRKILVQVSFIFPAPEREIRNVFQGDATMRFLPLPILLFASVTTLLAQSPQTNRAVDGRSGAAAAPVAGQPDANGVDTIIALVKANVSESLVLKTIQRQNKPYDLTPQDLVKLQQAGVSETIVNAMLDPSSVAAAKPVPAAAPAAPAPAPAAPAAAPVAAVPAPKGAPNAPKSASNATAPAAGCPQASATATPPAANQPEAKPGMFSSFKSKLKTSAEKTVDGLGDTLNCAADKGVQGSQTQVSSALDSAVATPAQKVSEVGSTVNSTAANATGVNPTGNKPAASMAASASPAQAAAKKSVQK
jgi:hypothetical protein